MTSRLAAGIVAFACALACAAAYTLMTLQMVDKVNGKLPKADQFDPAWWYWSKTMRLHREYRRFYPSGRLLRNVYLLYGAMAACALILLWAFGFFG